jgi:hypothetical protein
MSADPKLEWFEYHGPEALIVALNRVVTSGDVVQGPPELASAEGFVKTKKRPKDGGE